MHLNDFYKAFHKRFAVRELPKPKRARPYLVAGVLAFVVFSTSGCAMLLKYLKTFGFTF